HDVSVQRQQHPAGWHVPEPDGGLHAALRSPERDVQLLRSGLIGIRIQESGTARKERRAKRARLFFCPCPIIRWFLLERSRDGYACRWWSRSHRSVGGRLHVELARVEARGFDARACGRSRTSGACGGERVAA